MGLCVPAPASAIFSASANFENTRSAVDGGGIRDNSANFQSDSAVGEIATASRTSPSYLGRSGLMPIYYYPGRIMNFGVNGCQSSQITLTWQAPGDDGYASNTSAKAYIIKMSSDPALSPAASETLFFAANNATMAIPAPALQGTTQTLLITGLTNGVTYYFAILAVEADNDLGVLSAGATTQSGGLAQALTGFFAHSGIKKAFLGWNAAAGTPGACTPVAYRLYRSTDAVNSFSAVVDTSAVAYTDPGLRAGTTYFYKLLGLNSSAFEITIPTETSVWVHGGSPAPPVRVGLSVSTSGVVLTWKYPISYDFGQTFSTPTAALPEELTGYQVWRSTGLYGAAWTMMAYVDSSTLVYSDTSAAAGSWYKITAVNLTDASASSLIRDYNNQDGWALAPDGRSHLRIPGQNLMADLSPNPNADYWINVGTGSQAPAGNVFTAANFQVMSYDSTPMPATFEFPKPVTVSLSYKTAVNGSVVASGFNAAPTPDQTSLYWKNGVKWVKIFGKLDPLGQFMTAQTTMAGDYQLRSVHRESAVSFDVSGISNRFITPNGDGKNDNVVFTFDNPNDSAVSGRIFDMQGKLVASLSQKTQFTMEWDAKVNGAAVPGGVYIYQIQGDGKTFNGTLVVIK